MEFMAMKLKSKRKNKVFEARTMSNAFCYGQRVYELGFSMPFPNGIAARANETVFPTKFV